MWESAQNSQQLKSGCSGLRSFQTNSGEILLETSEMSKSRGTNFHLLDVVFYSAQEKHCSLGIIRHNSLF
jgi:hypothetical protein